MFIYLILRLFYKALKIKIKPSGDISLLLIYKDTTLWWLAKNLASYAAPESPIKASLIIIRGLSAKG